MTAQSSSKQNSKTQLSRKRKLTLSTGIENDCEWMEQSSRFYMTRSKQEPTGPESGHCHVDAVKRNRKKSLKRKHGKEDRKVTKKLKLSPSGNQTHCASADVPDIHEINSTENVTTEEVKKGVCDICMEEFEDLHSLTVHLRKHHVKENVCKICDTTLSSTSSLDRHMLRHSKEKPYKCQYCSQSFTTNGNMNRHMHKHEEHLKRSRSNKNSSHLKENHIDECLNEQATEPLHIKKEEKSQIEENVESIKITETKHTNHSQLDILLEACALNESNNVLEEKIEGTERVPIDTSPEQFQSQEINETKQSQQSVCSANTPVIRFLDLSFVPFSSSKFPLVAQKAREEITGRSRYGFSNYKCGICEKVFSDISSTIIHEKTHRYESNNMCPTCEVYSQSTSALRLHNLKCHDISNESWINPPSTKQSKAAFFRYMGLCRKEAIDNDIEEIELDELSYSTGEKQSINQIQMGNAFHTTVQESNSQNGIKSDMHNLKNLSKLTSQVIEKKLATNSNVIKADLPVAILNLEAVSNKTDRSEILKDDNDVCNEMSINNTTAEEHAYTENSNDFADIKSILSNVAVTPVATAQSETDRNTSSSSDDKDSNNDEMSSNSDSSMEKEDRPQSKNRPLYPCTVPDCLYKSADKSSVARHLRTHTKEHPFICVVCGCEFTTKANGVRHARKKHKMISPEISGIISYNKSLLSNSGDTETVCKYCDKNFFNYRVLQHHYRSLSNSCRQKPFACSKCKLGFATKNNYVRHYSNKHAKNSKLQSSVKLEAAKFIIKIKSGKKKKLIKRKRCPVVEKEDSTDKECQDVNNCSSEISSSPELSQEDKPHSFSDDDRVDAAESLVSLSRGTELHLPLDLSVRALDLSGQNKLPHSESNNENFISGESNSSFTSSINATPLPMDFSSRRMPVNIENFSDSFSTPLNHFNKSSLCFPTVASSFRPVVSMHPEASLLPILNNTATPINHQLSSNDSEYTINYPKTATPKAKVTDCKKIRIKCDYCESDFTLEANKKRHVKNKHPEHITQLAGAKHQSRNSARSVQGNEISKQIPSTILNTTKKALLNRVLQNTDHNKQNLEVDGGLNNQLQNRSTIKTKELEHLNEIKASSDLENVDLASVSSVINTANSPRFKQYLMEDMNYNVVSKSTSVLTATNSDSESSLNENESGSLRKSKGSKHPCNVCGRVFQWGSGLQRHTVKHTGYKPYTCTECMVRCTTKSNLTRHFRNKHGYMPMQKNKFNLHNRLNKDAYLKTVIKTESEETDEQDCSSLSFPEMRSSLGYQKKVNHTTLPEIPVDRLQSLECRFCNTTYKTPSDLSNHIKELHHSEYERMQGKKVNLPALKTLWKKN